MSRLIIIIGLVILALGFGYLMIWPRYQQLRDLSALVGEREEELASKEDYLLRLASVSRELEKYGDEINKINYALPDEADMPEVLAFLEQAASANGLVITKLEVFLEEPGPSLAFEGEDAVSEAQVAFTVSGTVDSLVSFLAALESSARLLKMESIVIEYIQLEPGQPQDILLFEIKLGVRWWNAQAVEKALFSNLEPKKIDINLETLKDPALQELKVFEEVVLPEEYGRENPFLPY